MRPSDAELVATFQAGDADAFEAIYCRYASLLTVYIWRRCGRWHLAEEMMQEAMLNAWKYIPHGTIHNLNGYLILLRSAAAHTKSRSIRMVATTARSALLRIW
jgi:DNA-directed RNA polymerase specialized sigma24 family protein